MGDLPTPSDLENGRFAKAEDYVLAKKIVSDELSELYLQGKLFGASFYGSTTNGEIRLGSDIDVMVVPYSIVDCMDNLQKIRSEVESLYVPIEINPLVSVRQAKKGMHGMRHAFKSYMQKAITDETIIGNNPLNAIGPNKVELPSALEFVLQREEELRRFTRDVSTPIFSRTHCKFLSRMVNYTLFVPKDIYFAKYERLPGDRIHSKAELVDIYKKEFPKMKSDALEDTLWFWKETKKMVENGNVNVKEYKELLQWFASQYDRVEEFIMQNNDLAKKMFNEMYGEFKRIG